MTKKIIIKEHNIVTDEIIEREMNNAEYETFQAEQKANVEAKAQVEAKAVQRQAIADRLGLTADELKLLLG